VQAQRLIEQLGYIPKVFTMHRNNFENNRRKELLPERIIGKVFSIIDLLV